MRHTVARVLPMLAALAVSTAAAAAPPAPLLRFEGGIGVDPLTAAGGADVLNTVRGVNPGGRAWVIRKLTATVNPDSTLVAQGRGLLFASGEAIGTRGAVTRVAATLTCGPADATATRYNTAPVDLDAAGNFSIRSRFSVDGSNVATLPSPCENPVLLIRGANPVTGALGGWFAVGIPAGPED
jgi:hypothetical protein